MSRMGIVVIAAIMVEAISIVQYERINSIMVEEGQVVQENEADEFHARLQTVRRHQVGLVLLGLAALAFMIRRYAHSEQKLRKADEENARIGAELKVANDIQQSMLPPRQFQQDEVEIFASLVPAREVGGDLFGEFDCGMVHDRAAAGGHGVERHGAVADDDRLSRVFAVDPGAA